MSHGRLGHHVKQSIESLPVVAVGKLKLVDDILAFELSGFDQLLDVICMLDLKRDLLGRRRLPLLLESPPLFLEQLSLNPFILSPLSLHLHLEHLL